MLSAPLTTVTAIAAVLAVALAAILPTCLYAYVEPRGRLSWGTAGDSPRSRRAPALVRLTAWVSFAVGQVAVAWLLVPAGCAVLLYLQSRLGVGGVLDVVATLAVAAMAIVQAVLAIRLIPLGVRLLARDSRLSDRIVRLATWNAVVSALLLGSGALLAWATPWLLHPWLRVALVWAALRPIMAYACACLIHALLLGQCARVLIDDSRRVDDSRR
ncbi:MAG: hypothetical protein WBY94_07060 [Polyangiaceae bacterium]